MEVRQTHFSLYGHDIVSRVSLVVSVDATFPDADFASTEAAVDYLEGRRFISVGGTDRAAESA